MSGHSKWATTKRHKALIDAKRGKIFTKMAKLVTIAARDGKSGDPTMNPGLRMAIENAKAASMPKDNIERAIQKGIGATAGEQIEEVIYEAYAPNGIGLVIECLTDNKNRTLGEIKAILNKYNGTLANAGSVAYQFERIGQIIIDASKNTLSGDDLEMAIIDSGAIDFEREGELYILVCEYSAMHNVRKSLEDAGVIIDSAEFIYRAKNLIELDEGKSESIGTIIEKIDDLDDVNNVYSNLSL